MDERFTDSERLQVLSNADSYWDINEQASQCLLESAFSLINGSPILSGLEQKMVGMIEELTTHVEIIKKGNWKKRLSIFLRLGYRLIDKILDEKSDINLSLKGLDWAERAGENEPDNLQKAIHLSMAADLSREIYYEHEEKLDYIVRSLNLDLRAAELSETLYPKFSGISFTRAAKDAFEIYQRTKGEARIEYLAQNGELNIKAGKVSLKTNPNHALECFQFASISFNKAYHRTRKIEYLMRRVEANVLFDENQEETQKTSPLIFAANACAQIFRRTDIQTYRTQAIHLYQRFLGEAYLERSSDDFIATARKALSELEEVSSQPNENLFKSQTVFL